MTQTTKTEKIVLILLPEKALKTVSKLLELGIETYTIEDINIANKDGSNVKPAKLITIVVPEHRTMAIYHGLNSISPEIRYEDVENRLKGRI